MATWRPFLYTHHTHTVAQQQQVLRRLNAAPDKFPTRCVTRQWQTLTLGIFPTQSHLLAITARESSSLFNSTEIPIQIRKKKKKQFPKTSPFFGMTSPELRACDYNTHKRYSDVIKAMDVDGGGEPIYTKTLRSVWVTDIDWKGLPPGGTRPPLSRTHWD